MKEAEDEKQQHFIKRHICDLWVLTEVWRKIRKLKPVPSSSAAHTSQSLIKIPVIPHNVHYCATFLLAKEAFPTQDPPDSKLQTECY